MEDFKNRKIIKNLVVDDDIDFSNIGFYDDFNALFDNQIYSTIKQPFINIIGCPASGKSFFIQKLIIYLLKTENQSKIIYLKANEEKIDHVLRKQKNMLIIYFKNLSPEKFNILTGAFKKNQTNEKKIKYHLIIDDYLGIHDLELLKNLKQFKKLMAFDRRHYNIAVYVLSQILKDRDVQEKTNYNLFLFTIPSSNFNDEYIFKNLFRNEETKKIIKENQFKYFLMGFNQNTNEEFLISKNI